MNIFLQLLFISLRIVFPVSMLLNPFPFAIANFLVDVVDGDVLTRLGMNEYTYQTLDKICDYFSYLFMLKISVRWRVKNIIFLLFIYRTIVQIAFFVTHDHSMLFLFQNYFELFFLIYAFLVYRHKGEGKAYEIYRKHRVFIWVTIFIAKFWNEWYLHIAHIDLSHAIFGL